MSTNTEKKEEFASIMTSEITVVDQTRKDTMTSFFEDDKSAESKSVYKPDDLRLDLSFLNSWFIRCRFSHKYHFLSDVIKSFSPASLYEYVISFPPPTKDIIYSTNQFTNMPEDILPMDDDRHENEMALSLAMKSDIDWMLSSPEDMRLNIAIGLSDLGGTQLWVKTYNLAVELLTDYERGKEEIQEEKTNKGKHKKKKKGKSESDAETDNEKIKEAEIIRDSIDDSPSLTNYETKLKEFEGFVSDMKRRIQKQKESHKKQKKKKNRDTNIDRLQLLPLWVNRKIFKFLDDKSMKTCEKVNPYWKNSLKEIKKESDVRKLINNKIRHMEIKYGLSGKFTDKIEKPQKKESRGRKKLKTAPVTTKRKESPKKVRSKSTDRHAVTVSSKSADTSKRPPTSTNLSYVGYPTKQYLFWKDAFQMRFKVVTISNEFTNNKTIAINKRWIAMSSDRDIAISNILTGALLPFRMKGHNCSVTTIVFHPNDGRLASASSDATVRRWDMWKEMELFSNPVSFVSSLVANSTYLVATGSDIIIYLWNLKEPVRTISEKIPTTSSFLTQDNILYYGNNEGALYTYSVASDTQISENLFCHYGKISGVKATSKLIFTSGDDGFIKAWKPFEKKAAMTSAKFDGRITSFTVKDVIVVIAFEDGKILIWDLFANFKLRVCKINVDEMPINNLAFHKDKTSFRIIVSSETNIKICLFPLRETKVNEGVGSPKTCRDIFVPTKNYLDQKLVMREEMNKEDENKASTILQITQCSNPRVRLNESNAEYISLQQSIPLKAALGLTHFFPRLYPRRITEDIMPHLYRPKVADKVLPKYSMYKTILPINNPYKFM